MSDCVTTATRLRYAAGFIGLGLFADAGAELDAIAPAEQNSLPALVLRSVVYAATKNWTGGSAVGAALCQRDPANAGHWIDYAYAVRRATGIPAAREILLTALAQHPLEPILHFNLACYEAQLGNLPAAQVHLGNACDIQPDCREMALTDSDLEPLHPWISDGMPTS